MFESQRGHYCANVSSGNRCATGGTEGRVRVNSRGFVNIEMPQNQNQKHDSGEHRGEPGEGKQTDLAEGELETVEESIRIHEQKGDLDTPQEKDRKKDAKTSQSFER